MSTSEEIASRAAQVRFVPWATSVIRVLALMPFVALGYVAGSAWFVIVYAVFGVQHGFVKGARIPEPQQRQPSLPQ